jgi:DNA repair protein RadD
MSQVRLREYQDAAITALLAHWAAGGGNALIDMATGLGKSVVIAQMIKLLLADYPTMRVLMLVDNQELAAQNYAALIRLWPRAPAGLYAAGLGRRDAHHQVTFAVIQSVHRRCRELGPRQLILVDECHMIPLDGEGMYRRLLETMTELDPNLRVGGLTATPFRMKGGSLVGSDGALFDAVVYSYGIGQGIDDGWLSPLVSRRGQDSASEISVKGVARAGGEFVAGALATAADDDDVTQAAVSDMIETARAEGRKSWLVFCVGVKHAMHVRDALRVRGVSAETVTGDTEAGERRRIIQDFKAGRITALTNAEVLTKGFDAPGVDLVAMLRPTLSPGLLIQIIGRGTRPIYPPGFNPNDASAEERRAAIASGPKPDCRVLDFSGNLTRHGPIDTIVVGPCRKKGEADPNAVKPDTVRGKECPNCKGIQPVAVRRCRDCDHEFPAPDEDPNHAGRAEDVAILSRDLKNVVDEIPVLSWQATTHEKFGQHPSMKVTYFAGVGAYPEWIAFQHIGPAGERARKWWAAHGGFDPAPRTCAEAIARFGELKMPLTITTKKNGKWWDITSRKFALSQDEVA